MIIEYRLQSVILRAEDIQEQFPALVPMLNSYLTAQNTPKKRKPRKKKKTVGVLIDKILADIQTK